MPADDEKPQHRVRITRPFYLGATEVTQGQYQAVTGQSPSYFKLAQTEVTQGKYRAVTGQSPSYFKGSDDCRWSRSPGTMRSRSVTS